MDIRRTRRCRRQPNPHRPRGTRVSLPPRRRVASAQTAARRSRPGCHSARAAGPASPREPPRDAFMAGQSSPTHGAAVKSSEVSGFYQKTPEDRWQVIRSFGELSDPDGARMTILHHRDEILSIANEKDPMLVKVGGGARDVEVRVVDTRRGHMVITHLVVDCRDAMGANAVNTMAEAVAPHIEQ